MSSPERPLCFGYQFLREIYPKEEESLHRAICHGEADREIEGRSYCLAHAPDKNKATEFHQLLTDRFEAKNFDFRGFWFATDTGFKGCEFDKNVDLRGAYFAGSVNFSEASFAGELRLRGAEIEGKTFFGQAKFDEPVRCDHAKFHDQVEWDCAIFNQGLELGKAVFEGAVYFTQTQFKAGAVVNFGEGLFKSGVKFARNEIEDGAELYFGEAIFEKPDRVHFFSLELKPRWFINADTRKFIFENVTFAGQTGTAEAELAKFDGLLNRLILLRAGKEAHPALPGAQEKRQPEYELLEITYRRLAENAEANNRYREASELRYLAMEAQRYSEGKGWAVWTSHWWYWLSSGYGEQTFRALAVLLLLWMVFAALYLMPFATFFRWETRTSNLQEYQSAVNEEKADKTGRRLNAAEALSYSFSVMSLQKPEPKPLSTPAYILVSLQSVLGPVQSALLLLAFRRKFMR